MRAIGVAPGHPKRMIKTLGFCLIVLLFYGCFIVIGFTVVAPTVV